MGIFKNIEVFDPNLTGEAEEKALEKSRAADISGQYFKNFEVARIKEVAGEWLNDRKNVVFGYPEKPEDNENPIYEIDENGYINSDRSVHLGNMNAIPAYIRFGTVKEFWCTMCNSLKTTDNFPNKVTGNMWINDSGIERITKFPVEIGGDCIIKNIPANSFGGIMGNGCEIHGSLYIGNENKQYDFDWYNFDWEDKNTLTVENRPRIKLHGALQVTLPKVKLAEIVKEYRSASETSKKLCPLRGIETGYKEGEEENDAFAYHLNNLCSPIEFMDLDRDPYRVLVNT